MNRTEYDEIKVNLIKKSLEKEKSDVYIPVERRRGPDGVINFLNLMCFLIWGAFCAVLAIIEKAGKNFANIERNDLLWADVNFWQVDLLKIAFFSTIGCMFICLICIILNFTRLKRRTDKIKKALVVCEMVFLIIAVFLILKLY